MNQEKTYYRIAELIANAINPREKRKKIMARLGYKSRGTFYRKMNAVSDAVNHFSVLEEEAIAEELGVPVSEIFFQSNLQPA